MGFEVMIIIYIVMALLSLVFRIAGKLRLGIPLLYIVLICSVLRDWANKNETLAIVIFGILMVLVIASWITTIVRAIRNRFGGGREEKNMQDVLLYQLQQAQAKGISPEGIRIHTEKGVPIVEYDRD